VSAPPEDHRELERLLESVRFHPRPSLEGEVYWRIRNGVVPRGSRAERLRWTLGIATAAVLTVIAVWLGARPSQPLKLVDQCCLDLDGGGARDDGLLVVSRRGTDVKRLAVYEDRDQSRSYTTGDRVLFDRDGAVTVAGPLEPGSRTWEFCCLDYDGGGSNDDALVVVARPPDQISMAAIYESSGSPGAPRMLR
jgi:hypothetical protein